MKVDIQKKVRIIQKSMETIRKSDRTLHTISFPRLAQELQMPLEELTSFFLNVEDLFSFILVQFETNTSIWVRFNQMTK